MVRYKLKEIRKMRGYTQKELSEKLNIPRSTYANYEQGLTSPSIEMAIKIKNVLRYHDDDIFLERKTVEQSMI